MVQRVIVSGIVLMLGAASVKADLNAAYSVGDMFFATYDLPVGTPNGVVRLANIEEYQAYQADAPAFLSEINVTDRGAVIGELFLSTGVVVSDPNFELLFVRSDSREMVDRYRIEAANGSVRVVDLNHAGSSSQRQGVSPSRISTDYNNLNSGVATLLAEVSRQLSEFNTHAVDEPAPVPSSPSVPSLELSPAPSSQAVPSTRGSGGPHSSDQPVAFLPETQQTAVVSEVHLATANLKNFILTILVVGLALLLAIALVLYKTRAMVDALGTPKPNAQPALNSYPDQATASLTFLNFIKEENQRNQEAYLKSIELLAANKQVEKISDQLKSQNAPKHTQVHEVNHEEQLQVGTPLAKPQRPTQRIVQMGSPSVPTRDAPQNVSKNVSKKAAGSQLSGEISAQVQEKLELAEVYKNMGDIFVASNLLNEVIKTGNAAEVAKARAALQKIGES